MVIKLSEYHKLPKLQAKVLNKIVENNPPSINKISKSIEKGGDYKNVYNIVKKFLKDGYIIDHADEGLYASYLGVNLALVNEADSKRVKTHLKKFFEGIELGNLLFACDVVEHPNLGLEVLRLFNQNTNNILLNNGKAPLIGLLLQNGKLMDFIELMNKYEHIRKASIEYGDKVMQAYKEIGWIDEEK